jgi:carboxyl-terminal processing protease
VVNSILLKPYSMKYFLTAAALLLASVSPAQLPAISKAATDAFIITRMAAKFHIQPRSLDKVLSADWFDALIKELDESKIFFTKEDMNQLQLYRGNLDDELLHRKTDFLQLLNRLYQQRVSMADTMIDNLCRQPFQFNTPGQFTIAEDTSCAADVPALRNKLAKMLKLATLHALLNWNAGVSVMQPAAKKKSLDSMELVVRKKIQTTLKRSITRMLQHPGGIEQEVATAYCQSLAICYDPHTAFFPPTEKENFESALGNAPMQFGFTLDEGDDGAAIIQHLKPGSPAFKSGQLNKGDKIQTIQWEGRQPIDVSGAGASELDAMLAADNHAQLTITIRKADGSMHTVLLAKEKGGNEEEDDKVKSFLLSGSKKIGYISLPAFYTDWGEVNVNSNGCAEDVAAEIIKLKKENIDGLILDLRFNGGGSMQEATALSGIFIDGGPVGQIKTRDPKTLTMKDVNRGSVYDGPLLLMVNGFSASAAEMIAGTLQDYNRALIAGSSTYGKATAQIVLPMDTTIDLYGDVRNRKADSYIKLTVEKLYRVTGLSAQATGVQPDLLLPDLLDADPRREAGEQFAFPSSSIEPNKYYKPYAALPLARLQALAKTQTDTALAFKHIRKFVQESKRQAAPTNYSLGWAAALEERKIWQPASDPLAVFTPTRLFTVINNAFEEKRLQISSDSRAVNDDWKERLLRDPALQVAVSVLIASAK